MSKKETLKAICELFNDGLLKLKDAIQYHSNSYILNCNDGKVLSISKENEK